MVTIGDVLAVVAALFGIGATLWAYVVAATYLAPAVTERARGRIEAGSWECGLMGTLAAFAPIAGLVLLGLPSPASKLVGTVVLTVSFAIAGLGAAGVAAILADRLREASGRTLSPFGATGRAAALLAAAVQIPLLGWLLFAPTLLLVGLGAGARAVFVRRTAMVAERESFAPEG